MNKVIFTPANSKKIFTTPAAELENVSPTIAKHVNGLDTKFQSLVLDAFETHGPMGAQPIVTGYWGSYSLDRLSAIYGVPGNA
jgi:hypothetical protein